jgi:chromosome segregation ATPase
MDISEAKIKIEQLNIEITKINDTHNSLNKEYIEIRKKIRLNEDLKKELLTDIKNLKNIIESENIFDDVKELEDFNTLTQDELIVISTNMDRRDYTAHVKRRWIDLSRLVKEVIELKKQYPGWILNNINLGGCYETMPPQNFYKFTFKTPQGHKLTLG